MRCFRAACLWCKRYMAARTPGMNNGASNRQLRMNIPKRLYAELQLGSSPRVRGVGGKHSGQSQGRRSGFPKRQPGSRGQRPGDSKPQSWTPILPASPPVPIPPLRIHSPASVLWGRQPPWPCPDNIRPCPCPERITPRPSPDSRRGIYCTGSANAGGSIVRCQGAPTSARENYSSSHAGIRHTLTVTCRDVTNEPSHQLRARGAPS
ncbi:hypothetical protein EDB80DRAFT_297477 [Ilyonectria destructans]|nr:hypothetical protein EDB80DRAFT_297477 [Ilyonectria destructans]